MVKIVIFHNAGGRPKIYEILCLFVDYIVIRSTFIFLVAEK